MPRRGEIFRRGVQRLGGKFTIRGIEGENAEAIVCTEPVERLKERLSSLCDGRAGHRAGDIDHVKHFHRHALGWLHRGRKRREEKASFLDAWFRRQEKR